MSVDTTSREERTVDDRESQPGGRWARMRGAIEAHPALSVFVLALVVRLAIVVGFVALIGGLGIFGDDMTYSRMAMDAAAGDTADWGDRTQFLYWDTATFTLLLTGVFFVFGPISWVGQMVVAFLGALTAGLTTRLALEAKLETWWAIAAGTVVALLPSQVLFSSLTLKDAAVWAVLVSLALLVAFANRMVDTRRLLLAAVGVVALLVAMRYLRTHTLIVCLWALAIAAWFGGTRRRIVRGLGALAVLVVLPLAFGFGPGGLDEVRSAAGSLEERRGAYAENAETAIAPTREQLAEEEPVDEPDGSGSSEFVEELSRLPYGLAVVVAGPFPWRSYANPRVEMARAAMALWYPLLLLAGIGTASLWRHRRSLAFPAFFGGGIALVFALAEGNFGTAYRHRGEFVWVVAVLAAFGLRSTVRWIRERRAASA